MSRRSSRPQKSSARRRPSPSAAPHPRTAPDAPCPCGLPAGYADCCGRLHRGEASAPTAEKLMRSRYSAFVVRDEAYLLRTWHPRTRPRHLDFDTGLRWSGLEILDTADGSPFHTTGTVTFRARYTEQGRAGELLEHSRFERHDGAWVYVTALDTD
ncbi:YchJ family protein [Streptomyces sp. NPDC001922]|uniref:YchJ family protein n=1 Tax=Streptomyces sp. NPDC001922 TaxID=3364624 RepID=UPI0036748E0E